MGTTPSSEVLSQFNLSADVKATRVLETGAQTHSDALLSHPVFRIYEIAGSTVADGQANVVSAARGDQVVYMPAVVHAGTPGVNHQPGADNLVSDGLCDRIATAKPAACCDRARGCACSWPATTITTSSRIPS